MRKIYSYIAPHFTGFAPNYFHGSCTLATCKQVIRRKANIGDIVIGIAPKANKNAILYWMEVNEKLPYANYNSDERFLNKIPKFNLSKDDLLGDNIYYPSGGEYFQRRSMHSNPDGSEHIKNKEKDLKGKYVLISFNYAILKGEQIFIPENLQCLIPGRNHNVLINKDIISEVTIFLGINGLK